MLDPRGAGEGTNLNIPLRRGTTIGPYLDALARALDAIVMEGGYAVAALGDNVSAFLSGF